MKIIQQGNLDSLKKPKKFYCEKCNCIFEADNDEYEYVSQFQREYCYCECPTCGNLVVKISYRVDEVRI